MDNLNSSTKKFPNCDEFDKAKKTIDFLGCPSETKIASVAVAGAGGLSSLSQLCSLEAVLSTST